MALLFAWKGKDTSVFAYMIPSASGVLGAYVIFYLNKSKMENIFKGKSDLLKQKLDLLKEYPDKTNEIEIETSKIDEAYDMKIEREMNESVQEDITIQG